MIKHLFILLTFCFMITSLLFGKNYSLSECVNGYEEMEWLSGKVFEFYKHNEKLPERIGLLEDYGDIARYYDYGVTLDKNGDSKIEIRFRFGKKNTLYKLVYEIDGEQHIETIFENGDLISGCRFSNDGKILECFDENGTYSPDFYLGIELPEQVMPD